jgi:hypothetical protein
MYALLLLVTSKVLQVVSALVAVRVMTEYLSPSELGTHYLVSTLIGLLCFGLLNPLGIFYGRFIVGWHQNNTLVPITNMFLRIRLMLLIPALVISWAIYNHFNYGDFTTLSIFLASIVILFVSQNNGFLLNVLNILVSIEKFAYYSIATTILSFGFAAILLFKTASGYAWLVGTAVGQCLIIIPIYLLIKRIPNSQKGTPDPGHPINVYAVLIYIAPVTATLFLQWFMGSSYRFFTEQTFSLEKLAEVGVGLFISAAVFQNLENIISQLVMPHYLHRITSHSQLDRALAINKLLHLVLPVFLTVLIYTIFMSPWLLKLLVAAPYHHLYLYVAIGAIIEFCRVMINQIGNIAHSELKPFYQTVCYIPGSAALFVLLFYIDEADSIINVLFALVVSQTIVLILLAILMSRLINYTINIKNLFFKVLFLSPPLIIFLLLVSVYSFLANYFTVLTLLSAMGLAYFVYIGDLDNIRNHGRTSNS